MRPSGQAVQAHMRASETAVWWVLIIFTFGFAYPAYRHRRNKLARTTQLYSP